MAYQKKHDRGTMRGLEYSSIILDEAENIFFRATSLHYKYCEVKRTNTKEKVSRIH